MTTAQDLQQQLIAVLDAHDASVSRHRDRVNQGLLTEAGHADAVSADAQAANLPGKVASVSRALDELESKADSAVKRYVDAIYAPAAGSATEQLLAENRAVRAWERLKVSLDQLAPVGAEIEGLSALQAAQGDDRRIIAEELPAYMVGRGGPSGDLEDQTRLVVDAVSAVEPEFAAALAYQRDLAPVVSHLRSMAEGVRRTIESNVPGGHREAITVRDSAIESLPTPPKRPDTRMPEKRAADSAAVAAALDRLRR
ncbi:hypothetical protein [Microbacterium sp. NPDC087589]|uniref:hypothetical protein n=1 Tax=Microbacterium sp. NPDC087589 TaxID=3364191 RepID=UPI0037F9F1A4